ncbi:hypothetical protein K490DRAFT_73328 [Saccharata proteae CBS 121410]|uniref:Microbial-type PARG catalytic domain-containing protein n=1 Tax=Saccharata proteae CBS 121410 TaxID=1314787 RepID=A0A9P4HTN6_9PEZI|nr:hypothetical protein K490DRAFT_73328 [Saccharata proteae CBS 121410]
MGRTEPTIVVQPQAFRRDVRSKQAKATVNKLIPALLPSHPRTRRGIETAELIVNPSPATNEPAAFVPSPPQKSNGATQQLQPLQIRLQVADTLDVASHLLQATNSSHKQKKPRVAVLNMASPLRPGGGFFDGATSQEERLCMRTTLYPSLHDSFYRLPEVGAVYTSDVLVFRDSSTEFKELPKKDRFFVDVITAGMLRFPDTEGEEGEPKRYASNKDRDLVSRKMRAVMRIAQAKGVDKVVLGAWGCGAYGNPVGEVARIWKRVLCGVDTKKGKVGKKSSGSVEAWDGLEVVFAIKERRMAEDFAEAFGAGLVFDDDPADGEGSIDGECSDHGVEETETKIKEMESQMAHVRNPDLKARLNLSSGDEKENESGSQGYDVSGDEDSTNQDG